MSYFGQTFKYLKKTFWLPTVAFLIPSVIACLLYTPYWEVSFVAAFDYHPYINAARTFAVMFGDEWKYVWPVVLVGITQTLAAAIVMSAMDLHFKTGRLSLRHPWRLVNNSVFPIAMGVAVMSVFAIVWRFLLFGLVMLIQVIMSSIGLPPTVALAVISVVAVGLFVLHVLIITPMLFWAPIMSVYGYKFRDAAATSFKLISGKKVFRSLILPMLICAGIQLLVGFLQPHNAVACVVSFFVFLATNVYTTVDIMLAFYEISGLERRDVKPYQAIPLPVIKKSEAHSDQHKEQASAEDVKTRSAKKTQDTTRVKQKDDVASDEKSKASGTSKKTGGTRARTKKEPKSNIENVVTEKSNVGMEVDNGV